MAKVITSQNFEAEVLNSDKPVLVDFWATCADPADDRRRSWKNWQRKATQSEK